MRLMILATAATLALGVAGCQRQPAEQEPAAPEGSMEQQQMEETTPGQQPGEAPDTQESVQPQDDSGAGTMDDQSSEPATSPSGM